MRVECGAMSTQDQLLSAHPPALAEELARLLVEAGVEVRLAAEPARPVRREEPPSGYIEGERAWGSQRMAARGGFGIGGRVQIYVAERDLARAQRRVALHPRDGPRRARELRPRQPGARPLPRLRRAAPRGGADLHRVRSRVPSLDVSNDDDPPLFASLAPQVADVFAARLAEAGVQFELKPADIGRGWEVQIYVPLADIPQARRVQLELIRAAVPDLPPDYDPHALTSEECPGCGTPVIEGAEECAECGLALPG